MTTTTRVMAGRYRVDDLIGRGGMAHVHRGYDLTLGREVAIKILDRELARDTAFRTRFRMEAQAASRMSHPSIVRVFDAGEDTTPEAGGSPAEPVPFIVMELVPGELLKDVIARGPVPAADAVRYADGILEALEYSHRAGVVHRDIKPGNVKITPAGTVKVMDFGIARAVSDSSSTVAETTQIIGTAAYFSPEQAKGEQVDARTDLYSTGVVLYEMLAGRQPFRGESPVAVAYQHVSETPLPPSEVRDEEHPERELERIRALEPIVLRAMAKDPFQRFPDAASFRTALDEAATGVVPTKKQLSSLTSELYGPSPRHAQETARTLRQLSSDTTMTRTQSGPPVAWVWAGVALLVVLLASVLIWVLAIKPTTDVPGAGRTVPNVAGQTYDAAVALLQKNDLRAIRIDQADAGVDKGKVISTDPAAGSNMDKGQSVTVYVSSGAAEISVPPLEGLSASAAKDALSKAGLQLGSVTQKNDPRSSHDTVLSASAAAGSKVAPGTVVDLVVASGVVTVNDLTGWPLDSATQALQQLGLTANPVENPGCKATDPKTVASMSVPPGDVPVQSTIDLGYCTGK
ncbi:Serine/threonine-protein kinase PknB [Microbacterium azadirachtae]|uniref:non-specific serine/threonine protein kinase n=2 Tax=Microbacterium azadirachtae TaxID=582680 RepID=A0A0F0KXH7_9MICO|nr:Serine/threonine-protein kinase PknB [Microbacterium azadirachtae]SDL66328.1 serine/threonine protein kinase [Microbacterium azadirachtae]SEF95723.1 serine/threonine protein kinase [Microbacterium azadirachtae]SEF98220.1 serine/threonine protein kinase [Microbacterium azadirachtae]